MAVIIQNDMNSDIVEDTIQRNIKEQEYLDYINEHISLVKKAYVMYFAPLIGINIISEYFSNNDFQLALSSSLEKIATHDASKFSDSEFDGYRAKYHPTDKEIHANQTYIDMVNENYELAWVHHYTTNDHHPKHWVDPKTGEIADMTLPAIIEMICDWEAMSMKFDTNTMEWYENKAKDEKSAMSTNTKNIVEEILYNIIHK